MYALKYIFLVWNMVPRVIDVMKILYFIFKWDFESMSIRQRCTIKILIFYFYNIQTLLLNMPEGKCLWSMLSMMVNSMIFNSDNSGWFPARLLNTCLILDKGIGISGFPRWVSDKESPAVQGTQVRSLSWEYHLDKEMATRSNILAREIPWTEETGGLQSMGCRRVRHSLTTKQLEFLNLNFFHCKKWGW